MVNINSSLSITSTSFFPSNASMRTSVVEQFTGESDFQSIVIPAGGTATVFGPTAPNLTASTVFLHVQSPNSNTSGFSILLSDQVSAPRLLATLLPKDFLCLPLAINEVGTTISAVNLNGSASAKLEIFWGVR